MVTDIHGEEVEVQVVSGIENGKLKEEDNGIVSTRKMEFVKRIEKKCHRNEPSMAPFGSSGRF